MVNKCKSIAPC